MSTGTLRKPRPLLKGTRWKAAVTYVVDGNQLEGMVLPFDEFDELGAMIEAGPSFAAIENIVITFTGETCPKTTLLKASQE